MWRLKSPHFFLSNPCTAQHNSSSPTQLVLFWYDWHENAWNGSAQILGKLQIQITFLIVNLVFLFFVQCLIFFQVNFCHREAISGCTGRPAFSSIIHLYMIVFLMFLDVHFDVICCYLMWNENKFDLIWFGVNLLCRLSFKGIIHKSPSVQSDQALIYSMLKYCPLL